MVSTAQSCIFIHWFSVWGTLVGVCSMLRNLEPYITTSLSLIQLTLTPLRLSWHLGIVVDQRCHLLFVLVFKVCIFIPFYCLCMHTFRANLFYLMIQWEQGLGDFYPTPFTNTCCYNSGLWFLSQKCPKCRTYFYFIISPLKVHSVSDWESWRFSCHQENNWQATNHFLLWGSWQWKEGKRKQFLWFEMDERAKNDPTLPTLFSFWR